MQIENIFGRIAIAIGLSISTMLAVPAASDAAVKTQSVVYTQGGTKLEGFLAYDDAAKGVRPGVVIVHDWMGLADNSKNRAKQMAELGYVAFAADIYGQGVRPKNAKEAGELAGKYKGDRKLLRARANAALEQLMQNPITDKSKMAAMGYCFGGTTALELARSGAPVKATVSFHGGLESPTPNDAKNIKGKILALHGADDPYVPAEEVAGFEKEMRDAKVDWQLVKYGGAVHSFTIQEAGNDSSKGAAYNAAADQRSFQAMQDFFNETLKK